MSFKCLKTPLRCFFCTVMWADEVERSLAKRLHWMGCSLTLVAAGTWHA